MPRLHCFVGVGSHLSHVNTYYVLRQWLQTLCGGRLAVYARFMSFLCGIRLRYGGGRDS